MLRTSSSILFLQAETEFHRCDRVFRTLHLREEELTESCLDAGINLSIPRTFRDFHTSHASGRGDRDSGGNGDDKAGGSHYNRRPVKTTILRSFVVLEGLDGAGTSTQLTLLSKRLKHAGKPHCATWEPTDGPVGKLLRAILAKEVKALPSTIAMLYAADRNEHVNAAETGILARTSRGELVICDRYVFSSLAYQSIDCGLDYVFGLNKDFPLPRCLIFIDTPVEVSQKRLSGRGRQELFDGQAFQARVRNNYLAAMERYQSSGMAISIVNGDRPQEAIHEEIWKILSGLPITGM